MLMFVSFSFLTESCESEKKENEWEWEDPDKNENSVDSLIKAKGWVIQSDFGELPEYIRVYKSPDFLQNKKAKAYLAVADIEHVTFSALGNASGYHTPGNFYETGKETVIMNGGYFWAGASLSLLCRNGETLSPNYQTTSRQNGSLIYYPTKGAFGKMQNGQFSVDWIYTVNGKTYAYPNPANNQSGSTPLPQPSASFPEGGSVWNVKEGIGGGPVLIKDGILKNTHVEELFDAESGIGPDANNPRSAIAVTSKNNLVFFVCEGRNMTEGVKGFTLKEVTNILLEIGCTQALNLDGGGSSCMLINGKETILPSDGKQRSVVTAVALN